jgi:shikimate kinase / 3-dehydroquinate synthase
VTRSVILIGFMATGKSTVGELLSAELGLPFVDLDAQVEARAGAPISAIFAERGEAGFRELEAEALVEVLAGVPAVVATGGGAPCFGDNLARMRAAGLVVALTAPLDDIFARVPDPASRPLLARPRAEVEALYRARTPIYRQAHVAVETSGREARDVARLVARAWHRAAGLDDDTLRDAVLVSVEDAVYPIAVTTGALDALGSRLRGALGGGGGRLGLVYDSQVGPLYGDRARRSLQAEGFEVVEVEVPAGETSKCAGELERLCAALVEGGLDRRSAVVALGGGVVGDLAGFAAAVLYRGVRVVQVPTTLLAMTDSAIGGKTGINLRSGKNLVGAFWQPSLVVADPSVLATLPPRELRAAYGELLKYGLLDGEDLYRRIDALAPAIAAGEIPGGLEDVIRRCAGIKSWVVGRDEREVTGERALLNLGHTVGHAIEAATRYEHYLHGEAVALGLVAACRVSARLGLCEPELEARVAATLQRAGLDADVDPWLARPDVLGRLGVDKKRAGAELAFVTLGGVGVPGLTRVAIDELPEILRG